MERRLSLTLPKKGRYVRISLIGGLAERVMKDGMQTSFYKENYLKMTNEELDKICDWIDHHITRYIGWNEWGSLRIIDDEKFKEDLKNAISKQQQ